MACRYPRWASAEVKLFRTADFARSKSGKRRTALGLGRVRFEVGFRDIVRGPPINRATMICLPQPLYGLLVIRPEEALFGTISQAPRRARASELQKGSVARLDDAL